MVVSSSKFGLLVAFLRTLEILYDVVSAAVVVVATVVVAAVMSLLSSVAH